MLADHTHLAVLFASEFNSKDKFVAIWKAMNRRSWLTNGGKLINPVPSDARLWDDIDKVVAYLREEGWLAPEEYGWDVADKWTGWQTNYTQRGFHPAGPPFQKAVKAPMNSRKSSKAKPTNKRAKTGDHHPPSAASAVASTLSALRGAADLRVPVASRAAARALAASQAPAASPAALPPPAASPAALPAPAAPPSASQVPSASPEPMRTTPARGNGTAAPLSPFNVSPSRPVAALPSAMGPPAMPALRLRVGTQSATLVPPPGPRRLDDLPELFQQLSPLFEDGLYINSANAYLILDMLDQLAAYLPTARAYGVSALAFLLGQPRSQQQDEIKARVFTWLNWTAYREPGGPAGHESSSDDDDQDVAMESPDGD
ncbi:unnamed protein product [Parajaminaea phylloscopi]